jgi:hypothetical protein
MQLCIFYYAILRDIPCVNALNLFMASWAIPTPLYTILALLLSVSRGGWLPHFPASSRTNSPHPTLILKSDADTATPRRFLRHERGILAESSKPLRASPGAAEGRKAIDRLRPSRAGNAHTHDRPLQSQKRVGFLEVPV